MFLKKFLRLIFLLKEKRFKEIWIYFIYLWGLLRIKKALILGNQQIKSRYGVLLSMNPNDKTFKFCVSGSYGNFYSERLKNYKSKFLFLDIGANQGIYTLCSSKNPFNIKSYAFEPVPQTFELLKKNVDINNLSHKCKLYNKALFEKKGYEQMELIDNHSGAASIFKNNPNSCTRNIVQIETISHLELNKIIGNENIPILIKIDTEGSESKIIKLIKKSFFMHRVTEIFYEIDKKWTNEDEIEIMLKKEGFKTFRKIGNTNHYDVLATKF